jgi:chemotaxis protein CheZ
MSDEHLSLTPSAPPPPTEADYEAIAAAVLETVRGRWFLGEYARRNRNADTELILKGLERIETLVRARPPAVSPAERVRIDLVEMAKAIAQTRAEIAAIKPDGDAKGTLSEATEELDSIVHTTERATSDILAAAEQVQEIAWTLRERGADGGICDSLDQRATDIYSACSFQDLTGQRTRKVVEVLGFLEDRIRAMIEIWGGAVPDMGAPAAVAAPHVGEDPNVPHLAQGEIDRMMPSARSDAPAPIRNGHDAAAYGGGTFTAPAATADRGIAAAASAAPRPAGGIAMAEPAIAAGHAGEIALTPAVAVVGATALALDFAAVEVARQPEAQAKPEPQVEAEPQGELERQAEPAPQAEPEAQAAPAPQAEPEAEPEPQGELEAQGELEPTPALDAQFGAMAQSAAPPESSGEAEVDPTSGERPDPAAVLKRILAIIRAPNDPSAELAAMDAPPPSDAAAPLFAPPEIATAETASAPTAEAPTAAEVLAATEALAVGNAVDPPVAEVPASTIAADAVVTDVLTPEATAVDLAGTVGPPTEDSAAPAEETAPAPLAAGSDAPPHDTMPFAGPLTVDQAVDELIRVRPQVPRAPAEPVLSAPIAPTEQIQPQAPEWTAALATPTEPVAEPPAPAEAVAPGAPVLIELPELTVGPSAEPAPVVQPEFGSGPSPAPAVPAAAAQTAEPGSETMLPDLLPSAAAGSAPSAVAAAALAPAVQAGIAPVAAAAAPVAAPDPVPAVTAPATGAAVPTPARHETLAAITALSDDEKIALFS